VLIFNRSVSSIHVGKDKLKKEADAGGNDIFILMRPCEL
jgi:hypothetical protein